MIIPGIIIDIAAGMKMCFLSMIKGFITLLTGYGKNYKKVPEDDEFSSVPEDNSGTTIILPGFYHVYDGGSRLKLIEDPSNRIVTNSAVIENCVVPGCYYSDPMRLLNPNSIDTVVENYVPREIEWPDRPPRIRKSINHIPYYFGEQFDELPNSDTQLWFSHYPTNFKNTEYCDKFYDRFETTCMICKSYAELLFLPCNHACICQYCFKEFQWDKVRGYYRLNPECPICKTYVTNVKRIKHWCDDYDTSSSDDSSGDISNSD